MAAGGKTVNFSEETPEVFEYEKVELPEEKTAQEQSEARKKWFMEYMSASMGIRIPESVLDEVSFEGVAKYIASGKCSKIITMAGAGISTSARIPDNRSPGVGLYDLRSDRRQKAKSLEDRFSIQKFIKDPVPFFERSKRFFEHALEPTPCHYFIRLLHEKGLLLRHFTQNIDTLERLAGLPEDKVVEAHGSYYTSHCIYCDNEYSFDWMEERVLRDEIPRCEDPDCNGVIKPDIVMFGESLSERFAQCAEEDSLNCDLLLIVGTSLAVLPFSSLTSKVKVSTPRLFINLDRGKTSNKHPMVDMITGGGFDFDSEENYRDVYKEATCDDAAYQLADLIGWGDELRALVKSEHESFLEKWKAKGKTIPPPADEASELPPSESTKADAKPSDKPKTGDGKTPDKQAATDKSGKTATVTQNAKSATLVNGKSTTSATSKSVSKTATSATSKSAASVTSKSASKSDTAATGKPGVGSHLKAKTSAPAAKGKSGQPGVPIKK